jgi:transcriptional regulator with XRE-family HTH domain
MHPKNTPANQSLAKVIREERKQRGHTQTAFALHAGLAPSYYGHIERGEMNPTVDTIMKMTTGLGMSASELFTRAEI